MGTGLGKILLYVLIVYVVRNIHTGSGAPERARYLSGICSRSGVGFIPARTAPDRQHSRML